MAAPLIRREGAVFTDFENWLGERSKDAFLRQYPPSTIISVVDAVIREKIRERYPNYKITRRITAFSFPTLDGTPQSLAEIADIIGLAQEARRLKYKVEMVDRGEDTADFAITERGKELLLGANIGLMVLATHDGGTPFTDFLQHVANAAKNIIVHVIGFNAVPARFSSHPFSLIREDVMRVLQEIPIAPRAEPRPMPHRAEPSRTLPSRPPSPSPRPMEYPPTSSRRRGIQTAAWTYLRDPAAVTDIVYRRLLRQTLACIQDVALNGWEGTPLQLFKEVRSQWPGLAPPDFDLSVILQVLTARFFAKKEILVYKPLEMTSFFEAHPSIVSQYPQRP